MREEGSTSERQSRHHATVRLGGGDRGSLAMRACARARAHACMLKLLQGACKICTFACV